MAGERTQLVAQFCSKASVSLEQLAFAPSASFRASRMLFRSRHAKYASRASQHFARLNLSGGSYSPSFFGCGFVEASAGAEDDQPGSQAIAVCGDRRRRCGRRSWDGSYTTLARCGQLNCIRRGPNRLSRLDAVCALNFQRLCWWQLCS
jgi:hypothetical protein